jgi:maltose O-acetyltransferase
MLARSFRLLRRAWRLARGVPDLPPGVRLGQRVYVGRDVQFDYRYARFITLEDDVTIVSGSSILCHDASSFRRLGVTWVAPVRVCDGAYVGSRSVLMPGVTVGPAAVVGAGSVVTRDVPAGAIVAGVPARQIGSVASLDRRRRDLLRDCGSFDSDLVYRNALPEESRDALLRAIQHFGGFFTTYPDSPLVAAERLLRPHSDGDQSTQASDS